MDLDNFLKQVKKDQYHKEIKDKDGKTIKRSLIVK